MDRANHHQHQQHSHQQHDRCAHCGNPFDDSSDHVKVDDAPCRVPIVSKSCNHIICLDCALNVHLQEEAKSEHGSPTALPWMDCPACHASYAFNANQLGGNGDNNTVTASATASSPPSHYARKVSVQESSSHPTPHAAASSSSYHYHHHHHPPPPPPPPPPQHYHHPSPSTPYYPPAAPASHHPASAYVSPPPQDPHHHHHHHPHNTPPYHQWQTMDYSPIPAATQQQYETPSDFHPPHAGLSPPDIRRLNVHHHRPPRYPTTTTIERKPSVPPHSPVNLPRKRMRTPIARSAQANKEMIVRSSTMSTTEEQEPTTAPSPTTSAGAAAAGSSSNRDDWLTCRICKRPVVVTCQRLLSGPSPDHEALWPQVRLGKRLAAALRQHNQQHHPDVFMWNVKGRAAMTCSQSSPDLEDDDAVAQTALVKALEASFEHLPHIGGVDDYETKAAFLSRTLRRIGFSYAYISYTSSEWTKWQQWKKDSYSRVQIQAKARQLLDRYECHVKDALDDQWAEISSLDHQEKLDLFQNIFVLPQCIFECLNHGRLPVRYGDVTSESAL